jgi:predicted GNAT family acetyltransferase
MTTPSQWAVTDNEAESRFEITIDGHRAELEYRRDGDRLVLVHTEVPDELGGRGIAGRLAAAAFDAAAADGSIVVPQCPFVRSWLDKHPDEAQRATIEWPAQ